MKLDIGVSYYPDNWKSADWEADLKNMTDYGITLIRFGEFSWSWVEPRNGKFDFSEMDKFLDLAERMGVRVILGTGTATPPLWVTTSFPDCRLINIDGLPCYSPRHFVCYDHPSLREITARYIESLISRYASHPVIEAWQVDNEPMIGGEVVESPTARDISCFYCYCPHTIAGFRQWLIRKYRNIEELNERWGNNFWSQRCGSWEDVQPPRRPTPSSWLDWCRFRDENLAGFLKWQREIIRNCDPKNHPVTVNIPICGPRSVPFAQHYLKQARGFDMVGQDMYLAGKWYRQAQVIAWITDLFKGICAEEQEPFVSELGAGPGRSPWNPRDSQLCSPEDLKKQIRTYLLHGIRRVLFFRWKAALSGSECGILNFCDFDGAVSERVKAVSREAGELAEYRIENQFDSSEVAIVFSRDSINMDYGMFGSNGNGHGFDSLEGWYLSLYDQNIRSNILFEEEATAEKMEEYRVVILAFNRVLSFSFSEHLKTYLQQGGSVILSPGTGYMDDFGRVNSEEPGFLAEAAGLKVERHISSPAAWKLHEGFSVEGPRAEISPTSAEVKTSFEDSAPAVLINKWGKGSCVYLCFDFGLEYLSSTGEGDETKAGFIRNLLVELGWNPSFEIEGLPSISRVEVRRYILADQLKLFIMNHNESDVVFSLRLECGETAARILDLGTKKKLSFSQPGGRIRIPDIRIPGGELKILEILYAVAKGK